MKGKPVNPRGAAFLHTGRENGDQLVGLIGEIMEAFFWNQIGSRREAKPIVSFTGFLAGDVEFGREIRLAPAAAGFLGIGTNGGAGPKELAA